jgi:3-oxoacyl-[acyl-carrier protein] reductase
MTLRLEGRRAVVTGGGRGIGRAFVERFLDEGARVAILDVDTDSAERTSRELADRGTVPVTRTDVSDPESVQAGLDAAAAALGGIDILVNNAALFGDWRQHDHTFENLKRMFDVNLLSLWLVTAAAAPYLVKSEAGRVINLSSTAAFNFSYRGETGEFPGLQSFSYKWTKYGVNGLTKYSAAQLGHWGVTVNAIAPGPTHSEAFNQHVDPAVAAEHLSAQLIKGKMQPADMAGVGAFFASDDARFVTGQVLMVSGGRWIQG